MPDNNTLEGSARPLVSIVMGSDSDWPTMKAAADALAEFGVAFEADVVSAHRMPEDMVRFGRGAHERGVRGSTCRVSCVGCVGWVERRVQCEGAQSGDGGDGGDGEGGDEGGAHHGLTPQY